MVSFWLLSKHVKLDITLWKIASMRFLSLQTTITSVDLLIQKTWASDKFAGPKSSLNTIFELISARLRQMRLQMLC